MIYVLFIFFIYFFGILFSPNPIEAMHFYKKNSNNGRNFMTLGLQAQKKMSFNRLLHTYELKALKKYNITIQYSDTQY